MYLSSGMVKKARGNYTERHVERSALLVSNLSGKVDTALNMSSRTKPLITPLGQPKKYRKDIPTFIDEYWKDNPMKFTPGRRLTSFPHFKLFLQMVQNPEKLKSRLFKYGNAHDDLNSSVV